MRHLAAEIEPEYVIACLETDKEGFYERLGWQTWRGPLAGRSENGLVPTPEQHGIMVLRLSETPALDFDSLLTIECQPGRIW
jgi:aminoglycoside 2'-N-acetyltransferase I